MTRCGPATGRRLTRSPSEQAAWERRIARAYRDGVEFTTIKATHGCDRAEAHEIAQRHGVPKRLEGRGRPGGLAAAAKRRARRAGDGGATA